MAILPRTTAELLVFADTHVKTWSGALSAVGLTQAQVDSVETALELAQNRFDLAAAANSAKLAATSAQNDAVAALRERLSATIAIIKGFADNSANPVAVYNAAELPVPASPSPAPPPGTPTNFVAEINQSGTVTLKWKCANPPGTSGTIYEVRRKIGNGGAGVFTFIGASGVREFADDTLPAGSTGVVYEVTGVRSTRRGNPAQFNVNFGVGGGGGLFITSTSETTMPAKMAA